MVRSGHRRTRSRASQVLVRHAAKFAVLVGWVGMLPLPVHPGRLARRDDHIIVSWPLPSPSSSRARVERDAARYSQAQVIVRVDSKIRPLVNS